MRATILVRPKDGILDPQGQAVEGALRQLGFGVSEARIGRLVDVELDADDAEDQVEDRGAVLVRDVELVGQRVRRGPQLVGGGGEVAPGGRGLGELLAEHLLELRGDQRGQRDRARIDRGRQRVEVVGRG